MDRPALASGDVADDLFATDGVTTAGAIDQKIVLAFYLKRVRTFAEEDALHGIRHLPDGIADGALRLRRFRRHGRSGFELIQYLPRREFSEANTGQQLRLRAQTILPSDLVV